MNKKFIVVVILSIVSLNSCRDRIDSKELVTYNKSENSIFSIISPNDDMAASSYYNEFKEGYDPAEDAFGSFIFEEIQSNSKYENHDSPLYWTHFFDQIKDGKMRLFIVMKDTVDKYGWKTVFKKRLYSKKYMFTLEDLNNRNWEVIYE